MPKRSVTAEQTYESSGKRPGTPVSTRLEEGALKLLDRRRGKRSRSAFVQDIIHKAIGWNEAPKRPNPPNQKAKR